MALRDLFKRRPPAAQVAAPGVVGVIQPTQSSSAKGDTAGGTPTGWVTRGQLNEMIQGTALAPFPPGDVPPIDEAQESEKGLDKVQSLENLYVVPSGIWLRYNPDTLVRKHGLFVYQKMRYDEQVKAVMNFKRDAIISRGWTFSYGAESQLDPDEQARRISIMNAIVAKYPASFIDALNGIATGRDFGFSLTEKVFGEVNIQGKTYVGINQLLLRDPRSFEFLTDEFGILRQFRQRAGGKYIPLDLRDFVFYVHSPEFDRFYGRSDLREAYRAWYSKDVIFKYWVLYLERMAGGLQVLTEKEQTSVRPGSAEYEAMKAAISNIFGSTGLMIPKGWDLQVINPASGTGDPYASAIEVLDLQIAKALLVPNLLGVSHTGKTGAYSQSQTQLESFYWTLQADASRMQVCINEQLFAPLGRLNFGDDETPCFKFKPLSEERLRWLVTTWVALVTGQAVVPTEADEQFIRQLLEMPRRAEGDEPLVTPQQTAQANAAAAAQKANQEAQAADKQGAGSGEEPAPEERFARIESELAALRAQRTVTVNVSADPASARRKLPGVAGAETTTGAPDRPTHVHGDPLSCSRLAFSQAVQRVAFSVIAQRQESGAKEVSKEASGQIAKVVKRLVGNNEALGNLIGSDPGSIASVEFSGDDKGKLKAIFRRGLGKSYLMGQTMARNELERAGHRRSNLRAARASFADLRDNAADYFEANSFRMAGNASDAVRSIIQQQLMNAVRYGLSPTQAREQIWETLATKGFVDRDDVDANEDDDTVIQHLGDALADADVSGSALTYLNTLTRTNMFEAMNEARFAEFTDPDLQGFVEGLEYSAVLDDRTTEICQALDGDIYSADSDLWDEYRPPNHFNCRSVLVPITQADGWDGTESAPPDVEPADGFGAGK